MLQKYADIIIDISHEAVDRPFEYKIPEMLLPEIKIGTHVNIPFGKGNHLRTGYVIGIKDKAEFPPEKLKEIAGICNKTDFGSGKLLALAVWIKENYGSTMINAIKTVMPVKKSVRSVVEKNVFLKDNLNISELKEKYDKKHAVAKLRLICALENEKSLPMETVKNKLNISASTLKSLEKEAVIEIKIHDILRSAGEYDFEKPFDINLNNEQKNVVREISEDIDNGIRKTYLLHGITGSGKTEVYVKLIQKVIKNGRQAIVLIPEISLTYQTVRYFRNYFGNRVTIINSKLSDGEKYDQFMKAKNGEVDVVIGPRSALFVPFERLGLIIVDEEHENSYKSDYPPKYHAREVAIKRAELEDASVILGSATPSVESYSRALAGQYKLLELKNRAGSGKPAETQVIDLRDELRHGNRSIISNRLAEDINDRLKKNEQIMLFINKRGYNSFVSCRSCGEAIKCPHCDVSLTKHNNNMLMCHYCGYQIKEPSICPSCKSKFIGGYGTGTQKVEEEIKKLFPLAKTLRMDRDTTTAKNSHERILESFGNGEADILIGTQMIVKGHDFSNVTLVGIILADLTLFDNDYRAGERTFDLITQAAGRAGRGNLPGKAVIQTYKPEHYAIRAAANQNYREFYDSEIAYRSVMKYPPAYNMLVMVMTASDEEILEKRTNEIYSYICGLYGDNKNMNIIGPSIPVISKIRDVYRRVVYVKDIKYNELADLKDRTEEFIEETEELSDFSCQFDFNPMNMY